MTPEELDHELSRFDPELPLTAAWTPPASWYREPAFLERERRRIFRRTWQAVGRRDEVRGPGEYFTGTLLGDPYVVLRDDDGRLRAFYNICRHHAAQICAGHGRLDELACPYHGWTYGLDGRLRRAPHLGRNDLFDPARFGLVEIEATTWGPLILMRLESGSGSPADELGELERRLDDTGYRDLKFVERRVYDLKCNWKVYVDNYLDGGYHVSVLHRGLAGQLDLKSYRTEMFDRYSIQSARAPEGAAAGPEGDFPERIGSGALYAWIYPNLMINRYGPILDTNLVVPLSADRTRVVFDFYFAPGAGESDPEFIPRSIAASHTVQEEDMGICESVQEGLASLGYERGIYAPALEAPTYHFHRLLAADLAGGG